MQEKPKTDAAGKKTEDGSEKESQSSEDQKRRSYYYDDAHGYEVYSESDNEDENDEPAEKAD